MAATAMNLDCPLDDIISEKLTSGVSHRGGKAHSGTGPIHATAVAAAPVKSFQLPPQMSQESKIIVSNLPSGVTKNQIQELFSTTVGPVNQVALSYDNRGVLKGTAQAFQQYNKRLIDQNRPMKVEIVVDPDRILPPPLSTRVAPAPKAANPPSAGANGQAANGGSCQGGHCGKVRGNKQPQKTAADLYAEMEDYQKAKE
ncbi:hypothetical protein BY996DRAFT_8410902 [Phakopsora pachyrhizi]|uniref:RRM domain-containing protein n=1 Tax=Phakopsora pachyrhizi TaxID=170000 RepID=A0AAV0ALT0_PHAPC|nr:hypothetical protein BY996DRAFT_8410902 [Phakopsora pachyrhizi]CAH7668841.1 hypothetical protein PPACK8108_LOCUS3402 [Phakopsora pachyrhizi]